MDEREKGRWGGGFVLLFNPDSITHHLSRLLSSQQRHRASHSGRAGADLLWASLGLRCGGLCLSLPAGGVQRIRSGEGAGGGRHMAAWKRCLLAGTAAFLWPLIGEQERLREAAASTNDRDR